MTPMKFTGRAAAGLVAGVAGYASYRHIYDVATGAGEPQTVAGVLPLAIDGLILVATLAMVEDKRNHRRPRASARVALVFGIIATLAANIASADPNLTSRLVAAVPALSFLLAVEVLARVGKRLDPEPATVVPAVTVAASEPTGPGAPAAEVTPEDDAPVPASEQAADATTPVKRSRPKTLTSAEKVKRAAAKFPLGTPAQIAAKAGVSESTARRYMPPLPSADALADAFEVPPGVIEDHYARMGYDPTGRDLASPSAPDAAETATETAVNGTPVDLTGATR